jgi:hypothetical protein
VFTDNFVLDSAVLIAVALITAGVVLAWPRQSESAEKLGLGFAFVAGTFAVIQILFLLAYMIGFEGPRYNSKASLVGAFFLGGIAYLALLAGPVLFALWLTCLVFGDRPPKSKRPQSGRHNG